MKVRVTYEQVIDSDDFYSDHSKEDREKFLTYENFTDAIFDSFSETPEDLTELLNYEIIEE